MRRVSLLFACLCILFCNDSSGQSRDSIVQNIAKSITSEELSYHLHILASNDYEGRETGEPGQKKAAQYIASYFSKIGIEPIDSSYYQEFPLYTVHPLGATISVEGRSHKSFEEFYYFPGFRDTIIDVREVVFVGYGISGENYNDYENVKVKGKVVIFLEDEPMDKKKKYLESGEKRRSSWSVQWRKKLNAAKENGAIAALIITEGMEQGMEFANHFISEPRMRIDTGGPVYTGFIPNYYISYGLANEIFGNELDIVEVKERIAKKKKPIHRTVNVSLQIESKSELRKFKSENVLGYIPGTDIKDELVVLTAHYDHIGIRENDVFNGADDDGSGTVALLEIAQAFMLAKNQGIGPRRSILIMPVSGEEKGLLGSEYYTKHPVFPLENTIADLNIDMIGRVDSLHKGNDNYVYVIGSDILSNELHQINEAMNTTYTSLELDYGYSDLDDPNRFYYRSDHYNFAKNNIPVIFYFSGVHEDYHQPTDTVDKIMFDKMTTITRLVFHTAWELSNRDERIQLNKSAE